MSASVTTIPEKRCIIATYTEPVDYVKDVNIALDEILAALKRIEKFPAYVLIDVKDLTNTTFNEMVTALGQVSLSESGIQQRKFDSVTIYVGRHDLLPMIVDALQQPRYGGYAHVYIAETLEDAHYRVDEMIKLEESNR